MPICSLCTWNHKGTTKLLVKSELEIGTKHRVVQREVHCFLWLRVMLPNSFHVLCPLLRCSTAVQLMCASVTASAAGQKEHTWQSVFQRQGQSSATGPCSSSYVCLCHLAGLSWERTGGQGTAPASPWCCRKWIFLFSYPPHFYLGRAQLPAESGTRDSWR